jgi:hypothetical protein
MKAESFYDNIKNVRDFSNINNSKFSLNSDIIHIGTGKNNLINRNWNKRNHFRIKKNPI